jgi:hypothetical protein
MVTVLLSHSNTVRQGHIAQFNGTIVHSASTRQRNYMSISCPCASIGRQSGTRNE